MRLALLALVLLPACVGTIDNTSSDGGAPQDLAGRDLAGADLSRLPGADLAMKTCAQVTCGAHAHCDTSSVSCVCDQGYGGDPNAGCAMQTPCGSCPASSHCDTSSNTCACDPGYVLQNGACAVAPIADPQGRAMSDVCTQWKSGHVVTDPNPWTAGTMTCDPGTLSRQGIDDTLRRSDLFRWLAGLYPITDDPTWDTNDQACAIMESVNGMLNHMPPMSWQCWTQAAYDASSSSNLATGTSVSDSIDLFMDDGGTSSLGHRRWVLNPPLDGVGVGYANGFTCYHVFGGGNMAPPSSWQSWPSPGYFPIGGMPSQGWSFHAQGVDFTNAAIAVTRVDDGASLAVTVKQLPQGYGVDAVEFDPMGWQAEAGKTYHVVVSGTSLGTVAYDVKPVACP